jgi:hypothetical protein
MAFGDNVLADLVDGMRSFRARPAPKKGAATIAVGCVPWLTEPAVVDELLQFDQCCIVVDKGCTHRDEVQRLAREGNGIHMDAISSSIYRRPGNYVEHFGEGGDIAAARVSGWAIGTPKPPILHAKVLLLGWTRWYEAEWPGGTYEAHEFLPERAWIGSANWTLASPRHAELGCWTEGEHVTDLGFWLAAIIAGSEPISSTAETPEPELVNRDYEGERDDHADGEWDDDEDD